MYNFCALISFEYKKLLNRKIVWITLAVLVGISIFAVYSPLMGEYYINGELADTHYNMAKKDIVQSKELSGRKIDDTLFQELRETGKRVPNGLYNFITEAGPQYNVTRTPLDDITKEALYTSREQKVRKAWEEAWLTREERKFLTELEKNVEIPMEYQYAERYQRMLSRTYSIGMMVMLFIAICVPSIFAEEHVRKTDQLNLSSRFGKKHLFLAKVFVGTTVSMAGAAVIFLSMLIPTAVIYGMDGFGAGMFFSVPPQYRVPAQIWDSLPMRLSDIQTMLGSRMIPFFQTCLPMWKAVPLFYLPAVPLVIYFSYRMYSRCQIGGR